MKYVIERLCDNFKNLFHDEPIAIFNDSDIAKRYGKKFEDLDRVIDL